MRIKIIIGLILLSRCIGYSQGEWNQWRFGVLISVGFNSGNPVLLPNSLMNAGDHITSSVSDSLGNLLFYSQGTQIWDRSNNVMQNGSGLFGWISAKQPVFAVPNIPFDSTYYIFTMGDTCHWPAPYYSLYYSIVDLRLNGGLGGIPAGMKNIHIVGADTCFNYLTGIRHYNNRDVWIVVKKRNPGQSYQSYLVTPAGINLSPIVSSSLLPMPFGPWQCNEGLIRISQDGEKLFCGDSAAAELCNFNNKTGLITPLFTFKSLQGIFAPYYPKWAEFSIDSRYIYVTGHSQNITTFGREALFQYDASKTDSVGFMQSEVLLGYNCAVLQMATNEKIYLTAERPSAEVDSLYVINNPSIQGLGCNFQPNIFSTGGKSPMRSLPQFLQKYKAYIHFSGDCQHDSVFFSGDIWPPPDSIHWDFGDPASGANNYSNAPDPSHVYATPGSYTVTLIVRHNDNRFDTSFQIITIKETPQPALGIDQTICLGDSVSFDAGFCAGCTYQWANLTTSQPNIGNGQTYKTGEAGIYMVSVTSTNGCIGRDTVQLFTSLTPVLTNSPLSKTICSGESTNISLTSSVPGTTFNWTATLTSGNITGFSADSGIVINQVLVNHIATTGEVTYHITPNVGSCIGSTVDFAVTVNPADSVKVTISASANNICAGIPVTFMATPVNPGTTPVYQWKVNGNIAGTNSPVYTYQPSNGDQVKCILTSSITVCISNNPATSNTITMTISPNLSVSVSVLASANPVCAGTSITFTAIPTYPGTNPIYQWKVNGIIVGTNSSTYTYIPTNGDLVKCVLTSSEVCATNNPASSNQILMVINSNFPVGVSISASANPFCPGTLVTFTAIPTNGGNSPQYQWKINGINAGTNNSNYTYSSAAGDLVSCVVTSNLPCASNNPATSNVLSMTINNPPQVTFTRCFDSVTTINAKPIKLKGGIPLGGTYSGPGVTTGIFYPAIAGVGTKTITYTYTNSALCSAQSFATIVTRNASPVTCGNAITDPRDNKTYPTVQIGSQCWMAANLNYGTMILSSSHQKDNCLPEKYCYNDLTANCQRGTANYQWDELMQYDDTPGLQGLCPPGWHVPTENDWSTLFTNYINNAFAGSPLKYSGYSGFNALLTGVRFMNKTLSFDGFATFFWSSTSHGSYKAWSHGMNDYDPSVSMYAAFRSNAFSVRCLKDN